MDASLIGLSLYLLISLVLFELTFNRNISKKFLRKSDDLERADWSFFKADQAWMLNQNPEILEIKVKNQKRSAYFLKPYGKEAETVIIIHGYTSSAINMSLFARLYSENFKMNALLIDLSAHGLSGGSLIRFGLGDYKDINLWINKLNEMGYTQNKVIHGISMGGSTAYFALAHDLNKDVKAIITDSAYTNLDPILKKQALKIYKSPVLLFMLGLSFWMKIFLGFSIQQINVYSYLKKIELPLLIIHGTNDHFVPFRQSEHLNEKFPQTQLKLFKNSEHACSVGDYEEEYIQTVKDFLA